MGLRGKERRKGGRQSVWGKGRGSEGGRERTVKTFRDEK
jgi:hypothetical protein